MMQRSAALPRRGLPSWPQPVGSLASLRTRLADPAMRPQLLWRGVWAPFWLWSDAPVPEIPHRERAAPPELGLAGQAVVGGLDRVRRRLWVSHAAAFVCRAVWLGIVFAALLMLIDLLGGRAFDPRPALVIGGLLLGAGIVLAALSQPSRARVARALDRSFDLHERLTTALDDLGLGVPAPGDRAPIVYLQMADAANAMAILRNDRRLRPAIPVREIVLVVLSGLVLATLAFARGLGGGLPELANAHVPKFTPAVERPVDPEPTQAEIEAAEMAPSVQEVIDRSDRSARARHDLQQLAAALSDHALTRQAAETITRGDYSAAGSQLRDAAAATSNLSDAARDALSSDLDHAAVTMAPETSGLHEATRDAASGLQQGGAPAQSEMRDLADAVEQAGAQVVPQSELASQMRNAQQSQAQQGDQGESRGSSASAEGAPGERSLQFSASGDPGNGADANASAASQPASEQAAQQSAAGNEAGGASEGQPGDAGEQGQGNAPAGGEQAGQGESAAPGNAAERGAGESGSQGAQDAAAAQQGGGAGTGAGEETDKSQVAAGAAADQSQGGEDAADPKVANGGAAEGEPAPASDGANESMALPAAAGQQAVQTSADGGSAMRGSGAGVTAGSGFAVQGEVGEAGPDSNRVPPDRRDTVERYFSSGSGE